MDIAISCLTRNNQVKIDELFTKVNFLKHIVFWIKSNRYLSYLLVNNRVIHRLFLTYIIPRKNPSIPNDIIRVEILTRLPVKSLMRFQCVCKSWLSIISSDLVFKESHLTRTSVDPNNDWLIVPCHSEVGGDVSPNKFDHPLFASDMNLAGSVNGLVCVYRYHEGSDSVPCIGIWNPATRRYKSVPPPSTASFVYFTHMSLAFGFDPIKNDYKVIFFTNNYEDKCGHLVADVYSCNAGSWGNINVSSSFILEPGSLSKRIVNANQCLYWPYGTCEYYNKKYYVISFDIRHEVFRLFPSLDILPHQYRFMANLRNSLVCIVHDDWAKTTNVDVYVLNETMSSDGGPWSKMYTIGPITLEIHMLFFHCFRNGDLLFKNRKQLKFVGVDRETHAVLDSSVHLFDASFHTYGLGHIETLVSVMGMKHINTKCDRILLIES